MHEAVLVDRDAGEGAGGAAVLGHADRREGRGELAQVLRPAGDRSSRCPIGDRLVAEVEGDLAGGGVVGGRERRGARRGLGHRGELAGVRRRVAEDDLVGAGARAPEAWSVIVDGPGVGLRAAGRRHRRREGHRQRLRGAEIVEILDRTGSAVPAAPGLGLGRGQVGVERRSPRSARAAKDERLICTGTRPAALSRGCAGMLPSGSAGQPISTRPRRRAQVAVGVGQERAGRGQHEGQVAVAVCPTEAIAVTGSMPRPVIAMSVGSRSVSSAPFGLDVPDRVGAHPAGGEPAAAADGARRVRRR